MKTIATVVLTFCCVGFASAQLSIVDDFHRAPTTDISTSPPPYRWVKLLNQDNGTASVQINADSTASAYNPLGSGHFGGVAWDTLVTDTSQGAIIVRRKGGNGINTTLFIYFRMNNKDGGSGNGYRLRYFDNPSGTDQIALQRVWGGVNGVDLVAMSREIQAGDTLVVKVEADKTMKGLVYGANGVRDSVVTIDNTYNPASWYWWLWGCVFPTPAAFSDFMLGPLPVFSGAPGCVVTPTTLNFGSVSGGSSRTDSVTVADTGAISLHILSAASSNAQFSVTPSSAFVGPGSQATFHVTYTPLMSGDASADIVFWHNAQGSPAIVSVTGSGTGSNFPMPVISSIQPLAGPTGTVVTITGANFNPSPGENAMRFGAVQVPVLSAGSTFLQASIPPSVTYACPTLLTNGLRATYESPFDLTFGSGHVLADSSFSSPVNYRSGINPHVVQPMDIDGDGRPDLVVLNGGNNSLSFYRNLGTGDSLTPGFFADPVNYATGSPYPMSYSHTLAIGDLDNDGRMDVAVVDLNNNIVMLFRNASTPGTISFDPFITLHVGLNPDAIALRDLDGDGKDDLIVANYGYQNISVFRNTSVPGSISLATQVDFSTASGPSSIGISDLDGDGRPDVVVGTLMGGISLFRNTSVAGTFTSASLAPQINLNPSSGGSALTLVDIDGDGKKDIAQLSGGLNLYRNVSSVGNLSFEPPVSFGLGSGPIWVTGGDLDGDGKPDLAVATQGSNTVSLFQNVSSSGSITAGSLSPRIDLPAGMGPRCVSIGNVGDDGQPELMVVNEFDSTVAVYKNNLAILSQFSVAPETVTTDSVPVGAWTADTVLVTNNGSGTLEVAGVASDDPQFTVSPGSALVPGGMQQEFIIRFAPLSIGMHTAHVSFAHSAKNSPAVITVVGKATSPVDTIVAIAEAHGSVSPSGLVVVIYDSSQTFRFMPEAAYHVDSVFVDGVAVPPDTVYTFTHVRANHTLRVTFAQNECTITVVAGPHGSVDPPGPVVVPFGSSATFTMRPDSAYFVDSLFVDGVYAGEDTVYTFEHLRINHELRVQFVQHLYAVSMSTNWNLISLPLRIPQACKSVLFPTAVSPAFAYDGSYTMVESLKSCVGYWLRFSSPQDFMIAGKRSVKDTIVVHSGWNLIGSISVALAASEIGSIPGGIITGRFFAFRGGYVPEDSLEPGFGYWVKVEEDGKLLLGPNGSLPPAARIRVVPGAELPPPPPDHPVARSEMPSQYRLEAPFPNPFNPTTTIRYDLPVVSRVRLILYNVLGEVTRVLVDGTEEPGYKQVVWEASSVAGGTYFCRLEATGVGGGRVPFVQVRKILLVK